MKTITHFEVYLVKLGRWTLHSRLGANAEERAVELARSMEIDSGRATQVIEETLEPGTGQVTVRVVVKPNKSATDIKPPDDATNLAGRLFMLVLNSIFIGVVVAIMVAVGISQGRDRMAFPTSTYNLMLFFTFSAAGLSAGLMLFRMYVPMEIILWRAKSAESQQLTAHALIHGTPEPASWAAFRDLPPPAPEASRPNVEDAPDAFTTEVVKPAVKLETNADQGEQTSFRLSAVDTTDPQTPAPSGEASGAAGGAAGGAADLIASLLAPHTQQLAQFADAANSVLLAARPTLQAFERYGFNLYLSGAALALADKTQFDGDLKRTLIRNVLTHSGTNAETAQSFGERVEASAERPRYRALMDAGRTAFAAQFEAVSADPHAALPGLIQQWADPSARGKAERLIFLLTDLVGSTALTSKLGNSGAQRVVRAHNSIVRQALKDFKGKEIKHTATASWERLPTV